MSSGKQSIGGKYGRAAAMPSTGYIVEGHNVRMLACWGISPQDDLGRMAGGKDAFVRHGGDTS